MLNEGDDVGEIFFQCTPMILFEKKLHNPSTDCYQVAVMECRKSCFRVGLFSGYSSQEFHASVYAEIVVRVHFDSFDSL